MLTLHLPLSGLCVCMQALSTAWQQRTPHISA